MNKTISILGCGWLGKPLAIKLIKKGNLVKGSTTSKHKFKEFDNLGIQPYLISLENLKENINDFIWINYDIWYLDLKHCLVVRVIRNRKNYLIFKLAYIINNNDIFFMICPK